MVVRAPAERLAAVRHRVGAALFERVAGPDGPANRARIHDTPGPRWFAPQSPVRRVHGDAAMFVGGLRALLLQSLHPLAMAAVAAHSGYRGDPWGRLHRTSTFLATTTFATAEDAQRAVDRVREVHERVRGTAPDGRRYHAGDPHLLNWVHVAEVDSFLNSYQHYSRHPLDSADCDSYIAGTAIVARALGAVDPPRTREQLTEQLAAYRSELHGTRQARETARFLLAHPPVPTALRPFYAVLAAAAVADLPPWARRELRLCNPPETLTTMLVQPAGRGLVSLIRWAMAEPRRQQ